MLHLMHCIFLAGYTSLPKAKKAKRKRKFLEASGDRGDILISPEEEADSEITKKKKGRCDCLSIRLTHFNSIMWTKR